MATALCHTVRRGGAVPAPPLPPPLWRTAAGMMPRRAAPPRPRNLQAPLLPRCGRGARCPSPFPPCCPPPPVAYRMPTRWTAWTQRVRRPPHAAPLATGGGPAAAAAAAAAVVPSTAHPSEAQASPLAAARPRPAVAQPRGAPPLPIAHPNPNPSRALPPIPVPRRPVPLHPGPRGGGRGGERGGGRHQRTGGRPWWGGWGGAGRGRGAGGVGRGARRFKGWMLRLAAHPAPGGGACATALLQHDARRSRGGRCAVRCLAARPPLLRPRRAAPHPQAPHPSAAAPRPFPPRPQ